MGVSTVQPLLDFLGNGRSITSGPPLSLEDESSQGNKKQRVDMSSTSVITKKGSRHMIMRRRRRIWLNNRRRARKGARLQSRLIKPASHRRITTTLRKLVPSVAGSSTTGGLDGLFREAADYIVSLQIRVKAMQVMVNVLSSSSDIDHE